MLDLHFTKKKIALCYDMGAVKFGMFICLFVTFDACLHNKCGKYLIFTSIVAQLYLLILQGKIVKESVLQNEIMFF